MNRLLSFLVIILLQPFAYGQTDFNTLRAEGDAYLYEKKYDSALIIYTLGRNLARQADDYTSEGFFLSDIGYTYLLQNKLKEAQDFFDKSKTLGEQIGDLNILAHSYLNLGIIMKQRGVYGKGNEYLLESVRLFERLKDKDGLASAYNTLADMKKSQGKFNDALTDLKQALKLREQLSLEDTSNTTEILVDIASSLNNIGEVYKEAGEYDSARYYLFLSLIKKQRLPDRLLQASTLTALAGIDHAEGKIIPAMHNYIKAYQLRRQYADRVGISNSANLIAGLFLEQKRLSDAAPYLDEALGIAHADSINGELLISYDLKRELFRLKKQYDSALIYDDLYIKQNKVIFNKEAARAIEDMEVKYEVGKKEEAHKLDIERIEFSRLKLWGGIIVVVLIASITILAYYREKRDNRKLEFARQNAEDAKAQIEALWKELNHRIKNNFQTLSSMLSIQGAQIGNDSMKKVFRDMENRILVMGMMHRKLYANKKFTLISIHTLINDLVEDLKISFNGEHVDISCELQAVDMDADKAIPMGLIVNEILTNAFKYAFDGHADPRLDIKLSSEGKTVILIASDNGPGIPEEKTNSQASFGFTLIRIFAKQLGGSFNFENRNGAYIRLVINR